MGHISIRIFVSSLILVGFLQALVIPNEDIRDNLIDTEDQYDEAELEEKWFEQYLNHFDVADNRTFYVRYFEEDKYFKPGGPLLLEIAGEGAISADSIRNGQSYLLAEKLNGKVVLVEHRYYGKSSPYENLTSDNLVHLSVEHALQDLAYFVDTFKKTTPGLENSKVGVFGCSYSAALATWFRYKFPHLVDAAWASSGPLRAVADFYEYLEVASSVYYNVSSLCYNTIKEGYEETKQLLSTPGGEERVKSRLENWGCGNITEMDGEQILGNIRFVVADHNIPPSHGIDSCRVLQEDKDNSTPFERLAKLLLVQSPSVCSNDDAEYPNDGLAWRYQTCTEFGFTITTTSEDQPFNDSKQAIDEDIQACIDNFGEEFNMDVMQRGIDKINRLYGSTNLKATKVLSVHGTHDPWHKLGLYQQTHEEAPVILIPGTAHCADQTIGDGDDPPQLVKAKSIARKIMSKWLH